MTRQLNAIYTGIRETKVQLEDAEDKLDAIMQTVLTKEDIYRTLNTFSEIYDQMTDFEKKTFLRSFVKSVEIYPDKSRKHGCYVKSIDFLFPVSYHGKEVYKVNLSKPNAEGEVDMSVSAQFEPHTESVVTLSKGEIDCKTVEVEFSLEEFDMASIVNDPTYPKIKEYVLEHTGLKVPSLYIAQIKKKCGLEVGECYNKPKSENSKTYICPPEKEQAIMDAFRYFGMI